MQSASSILSRRGTVILLSLIAIHVVWTQFAPGAVLLFVLWGPFVLSAMLSGAIDAPQENWNRNSSRFLVACVYVTLGLITFAPCVVAFAWNGIAPMLGGAWLVFLSIRVTNHLVEGRLPRKYVQMTSRL